LEGCLVVRQKKPGKVKLEKVPEPMRFDVIQTFKGSVLSPRSWMRRYRMKNYKDRRVHITMLLRNGDKDQFYVFPEAEQFYYQKGVYILDSSLAKFDIAANCNSLTYHQDFSVPINKDVDVNAMKKAGSDPRFSDLDIAFNPYALEKFTESKVVEGMMKGAGLQEWMQRMFILQITLLIILIVFFLIYAQKSGMFSQIGGAVGIG